jgi:hypothetical protein
MACSPRSLTSDGLAVVGPCIIKLTMICQLQLVIKDIKFWSAGGPVGFGNFLRLIKQIGKAIPCRVIRQ